MKTTFVFFVLAFSASLAQAQTYATSVQLPGGRVYKQYSIVKIIGVATVNGMPANSLQISSQWGFPSGPTTHPGSALGPGLYQIIHPNIGGSQNDPIVIPITITFSSGSTVIGTHLIYIRRQK